MTEQEQLEAAIASLQAQRALLGDAVVDAAVGPMGARLEALVAQEQSLKQVTVLFLDVVGSTPLASQLSPEALRDVMDATLKASSEIVRAHGGSVMQYAGDSVLAAFGVAQAQEDDAERAVRCGLALIPVGATLSERVQREHGHAGCNVRVGIHTGPVLLGGGMGSAATIWGNTVHLAARMEQTAPPGRVRISQDTWRLVRGAFDVEEQPGLLAKGYPEALQTWLVVGARQRSFRAPARGIEGIEIPLVGRATELELLATAFEATVAESALTLITLVGDAGLGKSRLVSEFERWLGRRAPSTLIFRGRAHPQSVRQPYGMLRDLLCWRCEIQDSDTLAVAQTKLAQSLGPVFGDRAEEQIALLGQLIGLDYRQSPHIAGILNDPRQLRARAFHAGVEYFRLLCAGSAGICAAALLLDDLHWADEGSLDFIEYLARNAAQLPIFMLSGTRPPLFERRPGWASGLPRQQRVDLSALSDAGRGVLADALLERIDDPPARLRELLIESADGNPYYMEELTLMLIDDGVIVTGTPRWQVVPEKLLTMHVPTTLTGVLQARIDGLSAPEKRALQQASVIGPLFWDEALAQLSPDAPHSLPGLNLRQLVLGHATSAFEQTREFAFKHHLLHQATYDGVLESHKREQHHITALWLERRCAGRSGEYLSLLAEHFERAGLTEQAVRYWTQAADDASRHSADDAALAHTDRALALGGGTDAASRFALMNVREGVFGRRSTRDAQVAAIAELERLAELADDNNLRLQAAQRKAWFLFSTDGELLQALDVAQRALRWAVPGTERDAARLHNVLLGSLARLGRFTEAREQGVAGLVVARRVQDRTVEAHRSITWETSPWSRATWAQRRRYTNRPRSPFATSAAVGVWPAREATSEIWRFCSAGPRRRATSCKTTFACAPKSATQPPRRVACPAWHWRNLSLAMPRPRSTAHELAAKLPLLSATAITRLRRAARWAMRTRRWETGTRPASNMRARLKALPRWTTPSAPRKPTPGWRGWRSPWAIAPPPRRRCTPSWRNKASSGRRRSPYDLHAGAYSTCVATRKRTRF